jgi:rod shape-determining protein MreD
VIAALKVGLLVLVAAVLQASVFNGVSILGGTPDLLLVVVTLIALCRGATVGAGAGFAAGLLLDTATLGALGLSSLLLTLVGYWAGRYAETARGGASATVSVALATAGYALGALALRFVLGEPAPAYEVLVATLLQTVALNLLVLWPARVVVRRWLPPRTSLPREEVALG